MTPSYPMPDPSGNPQTQARACTSTGTRAERSQQRAQLWRQSPGIAVIPAALLLRRDIPQSAKIMYAVCTTSLINNDAGVCIASNVFFAELFDVHESTAKRWIAALAAAGFLRVEHRGEQRLLIPQLVSAQQVTASPQNAPPKEPERKNEPSNGAKTVPAPAQKCATHRGKNALHTKSVDGEHLCEPLTNVNVASHPPPTPKTPTPKTPESGKAVSAAPMVKKAGEGHIDALVAETGDTKSHARFVQLWNLMRQAGQEALWDATVDALRAKLARDPNGIKSPGAWLNAEFARRMAEAGIAIPPPGHRQKRKRERDSVRGLLQGDGWNFASGKRDGGTA